MDTNQLLVEVDRSDPVFAVIEYALELRQNKYGTLSDSLTANEIFGIDIEEMDLQGVQQTSGGAWMRISNSCRAKVSGAIFLGTWNFVTGCSERGVPFRVVGRGQSAVLVSADETTLVGDLSDSSVVVLKENVLSVGWPKRTGCNGRMPEHRGFGVEGHGGS
jgi:hypothetical protein